MTPEIKNGSTSSFATSETDLCDHITESNKSIELSLKNYPVTVGCKIGESILFCVFIGLGISQLMYAVVHYKKEKSKRLMLRGRGKNWMLKTAMDISMVLACVFASFRGVVSFLSDVKDDHSCDIQGKLQVGLYATSLFFIYSVLWLRQLSLYTNVLLRHLVTTVIKLASFAIFLLLLAQILIILVLVLQFHHFVAVENGCIECPELEDREIIIEIVSTAVFQFGLVALFAYPLVKHRASCGTVSKIRGVLRRIIAAAVVCIVSDVLCGLFTIIHPVREVEVFVFAYYMNLLVHILSVVFSFRAWKKRFFPCVHLLKNRSYSPATV